MNKKVVIGIIIVVSIVSLSIVGVMKSTGSLSEIGGGTVYKVEVQKIVKGDISSYITANGTVEEVEKGELFFDTPVKVLNILAEEGQKVSKGQNLIEVDTSNLESELEKLRTTRRIQVLSGNSVLVDAEVKRAQTARNNTEKTYNDAKKAYDKNKKLFESKLITQAELNLSKNAMEQTESLYSSAKDAYNTALESRRISKETSAENLKITDMGISSLEKKISDLKALQTSPITGVVAAVNVEKGAYTNAMQPAVKVINPEKLQIKARVKEFDIKNVKVGQLARITGDAIDKNLEIKGEIASIAPAATVSRTVSGEETVVEVLISVDNSSGAMRPGYSTTCDIYTVNKKDVVIAPMTMITEDKDGNKLVFVVDTEKGIMKERLIKIGINSDMTVEVLEGLKEGETAILEPQAVYMDGARVKIVEAGK